LITERTLISRITHHNFLQKKQTGQYFDKFVIPNDECAISTGFLVFKDKDKVESAPGSPSIKNTAKGGNG